MAELKFSSDSIVSIQTISTIHLKVILGEITTKRKLDRETQKLYEVPVMATDGGGRSGFIIIRVKVTDENDNPPRFLLREYKATIQSNLTTHSGFLKVCHEVNIILDFMLL
jgi:hypothetical protein